MFLLVPARTIAASRLNNMQKSGVSVDSSAELNFLAKKLASIGSGNPGNIPFLVDTYGGGQATGFTEHTSGSLMLGVLGSSGIE